MGTSSKVKELGIVPLCEVDIVEQKFRKCNQLNCFTLNDIKSFEVNPMKNMTGHSI